MNSGSQFVQIRKFIQTVVTCGQAAARLCGRYEFAIDFDLGTAGIIAQGKRKLLR